MRRENSKKGWNILRENVIRDHVSLEQDYYECGKDTLINLSLDRIAMNNQKEIIIYNNITYQAVVSHDDLTCLKCEARSVCIENNKVRYMCFDFYKEGETHRPIYLKKITELTTKEDDV